MTSSTRAPIAFVLQDVDSRRFVASGLALTDAADDAVMFPSIVAAKRFAGRYSCEPSLRLVVTTAAAHAAAVPVGA